MSTQSALVDEFRRQAYAERGKVFRDPEPVPSFPLVPISIAAPDGSGGEVAEVGPESTTLSPCGKVMVP